MPINSSFQLPAQDVVVMTWTWAMTMMAWTMAREHDGRVWKDQQVKTPPPITVPAI